MSEENKAIYRRYINEIFNKGNVDLVDELVDPNLVDHSPAPGQEPGPEGFKNLVTMFRAAFPDLHSTIDLLISDGDIVVGRHTTTGTHRGEFMGMPPTNKSFTMSEIHMVRFANGKGVEHWGNADEIGMMQQIGAIPSP